MAFPTWLSRAEAQIINRLITAILKRGLTISVYDGMEYALNRSTERSLIQHETGQTCDTTYILRDGEGKRVGAFWLIHGNDEDVIADLYDNPLCDEIWSEINDQTHTG